MANLDPHLLDALAEMITLALDRDDIIDTIDNAFGEMYMNAEQEALGSEGMIRIQHQWLGRALLRVAEQQFILSYGGADDIQTPSSDQPEGEVLANAMGG
jgi:hypothetical protein